MTSHLAINPQSPPERALTLALRLSHAEHALSALTFGEVDAVIDPSGTPYLLRPAQEHLRQSENRLRAILESSADVITVVNRGGAIVSQSAAARRVLGFKPEEMLGKNIFEQAHPDDLARLYTAFFNVIEEFTPSATAQFRHRTGSGTFRLIEATLGRLHDSAAVACVVFALRPMTKSLPGHEAAEAFGDEHLAHDAPARELGARPADPESSPAETLISPATVEEFWSGPPRLPIEAIWRQHELAHRLREEPAHASASGLQIEVLDAHETARNVREICFAEAAAAQVELLFYLRAEHTLVRADWAKLLQIMCNLTLHAVEASLPCSTISIVSSNDITGALIVDFTDHGLGFDPAKKEQIFAPDAPAPRTELRLNLAATRQLTAAQGGSLTASSQGRGRGTTLRLSFPTNASAESGTALHLVDPNTGGAVVLAVLLVESHAGSPLAAQLLACGHTVIAAPDMRTGLAFAESCQFDLFLSDLVLADGDGAELMKRLRFTRPSLPGIALGANARDSELEPSREAGFADYLARPIALADLQAALLSRTKFPARAPHRDEHFEPWVGRDSNPQPTP